MATITLEPPAIPVRARRIGIAFAFGTAVISGFATFVNSFGLKGWANASLYTTAKNLVAAVILIGMLGFMTARRSREGLTRPKRPVQWLGLAVVAVIGGSVPFVLFFEGLARASWAQAAFIQKTMIVWVAGLAVVLLRERLHPAHLLAIAVLVWGQATLSGSLGQVAFGTGEAMVLAATLFWAVEVVLVRRILRDLSPLTVAVARMGGGVVLLVAYVVATGAVRDLPAVGPAGWGWAVLTGVILSGYVATWYSALARAQALDVTAVLVFGAVITVLLQAGLQGAPIAAPQTLGLVLVSTAVAAVAALTLRRGRREVVPVR